MINPNSPNWARPTPASQAALGGKRMNEAARIAISPFPPMNARSSRPTSTGFSASNWKSKNIPRDTKKKLTNTSRRGRMSPIARCRKSVSATIMPARNAPNASESPVKEVRYAVPIHKQRTVRMKTSLLRLAFTQRKRSGMTLREMAKSRTTTKAAFTSASIIACQVSGLSSPLIKRGTIRTMGTIHKS